MNRTRNRRRLKNYFIASKTHFKMMVANLIHTALVVAVIVWGVLSKFYHDIFLINDAHFQNYSAKFFVVLLNRLSIALIVIVLLAFLYQMLINHKFCGPLVNFSKTFKKISQGDLTRKIFLRRYDFLKEEADQVNEMIDSLSENIITLRKNHDLLMAVLAKVFVDEMTQDEIQNALQTIKKQADIYQQHLSVFKIDIRMNDRSS